MARKRRSVAIRRYFPRRSFRPRGKAKFTLPLAVVGGFVPMGAKLLADWQSTKDINIITRELGQFTTGFDWTTGRFNFASLRYGLLPIAAGFGVHMLAGRLGINRMIARAGIPVIRI